MARTTSCAGVLLLLISGAASAEQEPTASKTPAAINLHTAILMEAAQLSVREKRLRGEEMLKDIRSGAKAARKALDSAREAKDVVQLNCVNDKLKQIISVRKIAERASLTMIDHLARKDEDSGNHQYAIVSVAHKKVLALQVELEQCVGQAEVFTGAASVPVQSTTTPQAQILGNGSGDGNAAPNTPVAPAGAGGNVTGGTNTDGGGGGDNTGGGGTTPPPASPPPASGS